MYRVLLTSPSHHADTDMLVVLLLFLFCPFFFFDGVGGWGVGFNLLVLIHV